MRLQDKLPNTTNVLVCISKEKADDMFEALPPIFGNNCWAMGEPSSSNDAGKPRFFWVQKRGNLFVCCLGTRIEAQEAFKLPTPAQIFVCCDDPSVRGGRCVNCGEWHEEICMVTKS